MTLPLFGLARIRPNFVEKFSLDKIYLYRNLDSVADEVLFETSDYAVCLAKSKFTLRSIFRLRYKVFYKELAKSRTLLRLDKDSFDNFADHLVVKHKKSKKIVGYYRLIQAVDSKDFYSSTEYDLNNFINLAGNKLELSRACVNPKFRSGQVISLLWRGVLEYCKDNNIRWLFGIPSIQIQDDNLAQKYYEYFKNNNLVCDEINVSQVAGSLKNSGLNTFSSSEKEITEDDIPPLMRVYFKAGAKIAGNYFYDDKLKCTDFFIILDLNNISDRYKKFIS